MSAIFHSLLKILAELALHVLGIALPTVVGVWAFFSYFFGPGKAFRMLFIDRFRRRREA